MAMLVLACYLPSSLNTPKSEAIKVAAAAKKEKAARACSGAEAEAAENDALLGH
jgi:hypothetical protein